MWQLRLGILEDHIEIPSTFHANFKESTVGRLVTLKQKLVVYTRDLKKVIGEKCGITN